MTAETGGMMLAMPCNRATRRRRARKGVGPLMDELDRELKAMLAESESWSLKEWRAKAGLYADLEAVRRRVCQEDCFGMFGRGADGRRKAAEGIEDGFGLNSRLLRRLQDEGPRRVAREILKSWDMDMTWQARSGEREDLAQILLIGY